MLARTRSTRFWLCCIGEELPNSLCHNYQGFVITSGSLNLPYLSPISIIVKYLTSTIAYRRTLPALEATIK
jgi:hypothetical protein